MGLDEMKGLADLRQAAVKTMDFGSRIYVFGCFFLELQTLAGNVKKVASMVPQEELRHKKTKAFMEDKTASAFASAIAAGYDEAFHWKKKDKQQTKRTLGNVGTDNDTDTASSSDSDAKK